MQMNNKNVDKNLEDFEILIKHLNLAISNLKKNKETILNELNKWKSEITIKEIEEGLNLISEKTNVWLKQYKKTKNILIISLKEYDLVSKEASYILGECALIDELYMEIIHFQIGCIGNKMCDEIKKGGTVNWG